MAVTQNTLKSTLAVRIRNGQDSSGAWKYKNVNLNGIKDDFGTGADASLDLSRAGALYGLISPVLVGVADGMRFVQTNELVVS